MVRALKLFLIQMESMNSFLTFKVLEKENDHMHLLVGNELSEEKVSDHENINVKHVKIRMLE